MKVNTILAAVLVVMAGRAYAADGADLNGLRAADVRAAVRIAFPMPEMTKSNYPQDYTYQKVHVLSKGPAVVATVESGVLDQRLIIGYRKNGILGGADKLSAVVKVAYYSGDGAIKVSQRVIEIGKEWHGTGFITPGMLHHNYINLVDGLGFRGIQRIEIAFFAGPQWDSNYGANYTVTPAELAASKAQYVSGPAASEVDASSWDFIISQLGR